MGKVPNPPPGGGARSNEDIDARQARLLTDFPEWTFRYERMFELRWEAARRPYRYPASGCFSWIRADSEERLRKLLTAAHQAEAKTAKASTEAPVYGERCTR